MFGEKSEGATPARDLKQFVDIGGNPLREVELRQCRDVYDGLKAWADAVPCDTKGIHVVPHVELIEGGSFSVHYDPRNGTLLVKDFDGNTDIAFGSDGLPMKIDPSEPDPIKVYMFLVNSISYICCGYGTDGAAEDIARAQISLAREELQRRHGRPNEN